MSACDIVLAACRGGFHVTQADAHRRQLAAIGADGGKTGRGALHRDAELKDVVQILDAAGSGSSRNRPLPGSAETNAPSPWRVSINSSDFSRDIASRTTIRETSNRSASSFSEGSRAPGAIFT